VSTKNGVVHPVIDPIKADRVFFSGYDSLFSRLCLEYFTGGGGTQGRGTGGVLEYGDGHWVFSLYSAPGTRLNLVDTPYFVMPTRRQPRRLTAKTPDSQDAPKPHGSPIP
jgi:hypothetical protein